MKVHYPPTSFLGKFDQFVRSLDLSNPESLSLLCLPMQTHAHPLVLAMTAALASRVSSAAISIDDFPTTSAEHLERMGLYRALGKSSGITLPEQESAGRYIPITNVLSSEGLGNFLKEITPLLHLGQDQSESVRYVMSELGRNVLEHAETRTGAFFAAQYYPDSNTVRIGIADTGIGIERAIQESYREARGLEAIRLALTPGITGTTRKEGGTAQNAGAGLFFIKSIATANRDQMVVYSGSCLYKLLPRTTSDLALNVDPFNDHHSKTDDLPYWQGTCVGIDMTLNPTIEFNTVMDLLRKTYAEAIRDRKKASKLKRPRFV
jgi:anti-sigma regulatory factor (Ser/Thr protein kinase)